MKCKKMIFLLGLAIIFSTAATAQTYKYIGATKCKMCHNKATTGEQYKKWAAGPHANSMKSLSSAKSMDYAKKHGIADPTKDAKCIKCHSTAGGVSKDLQAGITMDEGVSCESCHGPGSAYWTPAVMKDKTKAMAKGLVVPDKKVCVTCHNEKNPFNKPFNYDTYKAKIAHPNPAAH